MLLVGSYNSIQKGAFLYFVANVVPAPVDDVGDQERMVLLPEEVGEKGFLGSMSPTFRDRLLYKRTREDRCYGPGWKQRAET
ncbi:hypothetical protein TNCV_800301 [Trichonephila clavipes]|nr:hypothetical protein TNCV_800301 [Trichonephila clavipes]